MTRLSTGLQRDTLIRGTVGAMSQQTHPDPGDRVDLARSVDEADDGPRRIPTIPDQRSVLTSAQFRARGWTSDAVRHARDRRIQQVFPRVFVSHRGPLDAQDRTIAAYLWAGEGAVLTGRVALERHGLDVPSLGTCLFLVPSTHRSRRVAGVTTVRTTRPVPIAAFRDCVPMTDVARALCDAAAHQQLIGNELRGATMSALQRRLTHPDRLRAELDERPRNGLQSVHEALNDFSAGAWSLPEAALARLIKDDPSLPECLLNKQLRTPDKVLIGVPDGYFEDGGVAIQVHSKTFHSGHDDEGKDRWSATVERDGTMVEHEVIVVPITPTSIERRPQQVLARIRRVVMANRGRALPDVIVHEREQPTTE